MTERVEEAARSTSHAGGGARAERYRAAGLWRDASIGERFLATCAAEPSAIALLDADRAIDFATLRERVLAVAAALKRRGVGSGDAVAYQLPNWWEAATAFLATLAVGARAVPIVPILRRREVGFILEQTRPRLVIVAGDYRGIDYAAQAEVAAGRIPGYAPRIIVARGEAGAGREPFASLVHEPATPELTSPAPDSLALVIYTSGSTSDPKGALHSHNTLGAELSSLVVAHGLGPRDRVLMPSPLTHISGVIHGILGPALLGTSAVLMDRWEPGAGLAAIERHRVTYLIGAPTFLQEMLAHADIARHDLSSLRLCSCGGASVTPELMRLGRERIPTMVTKRSYGSSEFPTIATTTAEDAIARGLDTEGRALQGVEIRIADDAGHPLPAGAEGEIRARGPECFLGYADPALDAESFDAEGFFRTGDLGILDADGYLRVTGRVKDIIVRKGEKISAREVEDLLAELPGVADLAVIPVADAATGERVCACLQMAPGLEPPTLEAILGFLRARDLTRQKLPEQLVSVEELPRTPSGKINKRLLRERIETLGRGSPARGGKT